MPQTADVVIAGAGIAGIAAAYQLAERHGVSNALLVDPHPPLTLTSEKTGANYREWWPRRPMVELARRSIALMVELCREGAGFAMNRRGYLYVTRDPRLAVTLPDLAARHQKAGIEPLRIHGPGVSTAKYQPSAAEGLSGPDGADLLLDPTLITTAFGYLAPDVAGAIHVRNAGTLDTVGLGHCLLTRAERHGVRLLRGEVTGIECQRNRVQAVVVDTGRDQIRIATRCLLDAAGPFAGRVAALLNVELPVVSVPQQKVLFADPHGAIPRDAPFTIDLDPKELPWTTAERQRLGASPRTARLLARLPGGLHIKPDGTDDRPLVKMGWAFNDEAEEPVFEPAIPAEFARAVLLGAVGLVPALAPYVRPDATPVSHTAGYYTKTPDDLPLIGPLELEGAYVLGGLAGYGAMVACAAAEIAAAWIAGGSRPALASAFVVDRFNDSRLLDQQHEASGAL